MNVVELLDEVGHTKLTCQYIHECATNAQELGRGRDKHTKVTFGTHNFAVSDMLHPTKVGLIVWMDRADFERAQTALKG